MNDRERKDSDDEPQGSKGVGRMPSQSDKGNSPDDFEGKQSYRDSGGEFSDDKK